MRWKPIPEKVVLVLCSPILIISLPPFLALLGLLWLGRQWEQLFGPKREWAAFYAWRPIKINDWFDNDCDRWVWLETIERRRDHGLVEYRLQETKGSDQ